MADAGYEINGGPVAREQFYAVACDPRRSVAIEACAGAGKTWMLVSRILRALLEGAQPHEILAITFTKKAAGEMRQRLQEWLAQFATASPAELEEALLARGVPPAQVASLVQPLQQLYAKVLEGGRGVQIRTFHSWFAALLRNAPIATLEELGLPPRHELLEDDSRAVDKVWRRFHTIVAADEAPRADYLAAIAAHGRFQTLKGLRAALDKRVEFTLADATGIVDGSVRHWHDMFPEFAGAKEPVALLGRPGRVRETLTVAARALGRANAPTFSAFGVQLERALGEGDLAAALDALLTRRLEPRKFNDRLEGIAQVRQAQSVGLELCRARAQYDAWLHQQRLARLARVLIREFAALKRDEGWVDMSDVEQAAHHLLADDVLSGWVQERLDARVRHLLVDEFQDTNPLQWQALHAWLSGYAGAGGAAPSVFMVGDPKQSIYRFRRAEPQVFAAAQRFIRLELGGDLLSCDHTHRNAPELIDAINAVMQAAQQAGQYQGFRPHTTQSQEAGRLLRLPVIERPDAGGPEPEEAELDWRDSLLTPRELPEERLVALECRQAAHWIAARVASGTPPEDILVLARRRDRLALMEEELRALRVPAQQPEKIDLAEAPEVQDVVALLDVLVSPTHDLSLARALKSPLFGVGDDALVQLALRARQRQAEGAHRTWLELLRTEAGLPPALAAAAAFLARWKEWLDSLPPHDALNEIYHDGGVLERYAQAVPAPLLGPTLANLRALPGTALQIDGGRYATPYALVRALKAGGNAGPATAQEHAVRLLTVHGAKGLEAPVVLMLDTDAAAARPETMGVVVDWPGEDKAPRRFTFLASETRPPECSTEAMVVELAAREREELNGLYVAMTRAGRELVLSSVQPRNPVEGSWWSRLEPFCAPVDVPVSPKSSDAAREPIELLVVPAAPVRAVPAPAAAVREVATPESRFGQALHRILEVQGKGPALAPARLARIGRDFGLDGAALLEARDMAVRILGGEGAWAWDERHVDWQGNEVELVHEGEVLRLDRLVRRRGSAEWWVLDYKSAARPERDAELREQLLRYRRAIAALHPAHPVRAAFLTGTGKLVELA